MQPGSSHSSSSSKLRPDLLCSQVAPTAMRCDLYVALAADSQSLGLTMCRNRQDSAAQAWKPFVSPTGDHVTKLNVYKSFVEVPCPSLLLIRSAASTC